MVTRRAFLGALAALPVLGRFFTSPTAPAPTALLKYSFKCTAPDVVAMKQSYVTITLPRPPAAAKWTVLWVNNKPHSLHRLGQKPVFLSGGQRVVLESPEQPGDRS